MGFPYWYGWGGTLDARKPFTVVTRFRTEGDTDEGALKEIEQFYVQDGQRFDNPISTVGGSITSQYCSQKAAVFSHPDDFAAKGGMARIEAALDQGMVLAMSIWDDPNTRLRWLDSDYPYPGYDPYTQAGIRR